MSFALLVIQGQDALRTLVMWYFSYQEKAILRLQFEWFLYYQYNIIIYINRKLNNPIILFINSINIIKTRFSPSQFLQQIYPNPIINPKLLSINQPNQHQNTNQQSPTYSQTQSQSSKMNKDYSSDIKQVERFMFDNSIYLLNMFEKKIDSFINTKTKKQREKDLNVYRQENNRCDPNTFFDDPIKILARDLTKPIWNCVTKIDPHVYIDYGDSFSQHLTQSPFRIFYTSLLKHFFHRYKTEHQDESNHNINLSQCHHVHDLSNSLNIEQKQIQQTVTSSTRQLFKLLNKCIMKENQLLEGLQNLGQVEENYRYLRSTLQGYSEVVVGFLQDVEKQVKANIQPSKDTKTDQPQKTKKLIAIDPQPTKEQNKQLRWFLTITMNAFINILDSKGGATLLCIQPKIGLINLLIHPLLISLHNILTIQFKYNQKQKHIKQQNQNRHHNKQIIIEEQEYNSPKNNNKIMEEEIPQGDKHKDGIVFEELKYSNCSRMAFINLDGYESQYNLDVVKYLSKYLMYVSFPKESFNRKESNQLKEFEQYKSQRLLRKFFYQALTPEEKKELLKLHEVDEPSFKRNMFILPVNSRSLSQKYELFHEQNGNENHSIEFYESSFIKFMMEEVVMSHLREYNPSMIILSYSGKIHLDNEYFVEMIKQLTVISNFRLVFYPNHAKMFCFQQKGAEIIAGEDFFNLEQKYYQDYEKAKIDVFHKAQHGSVLSGRMNDNNSFNTGIGNSLSAFSQLSLDVQFLDKMSMFLKVSSGTYNLTKAIEEDSYIEKFKNYKIMRYSALLLKNIAKEYPTIERLKMRANEYLTISKVLRNNYANKTETFDKLFQKVVSKYHDTLIKVLQKLIFLDQSLLKSLVPPTISSSTIPLTSPPFNQQQLLIIRSSLPLLLQLCSQFDYLEKKQIWQDFKFQYRLELSTQKTQSRFYLHIPKYKDKQVINTTKKIDDLVAAVEFQIVQQGKQKIGVELTPSTKLMYSPTRMYKQAIIYLINHIPKQKSFNYSSYYGILNQQIDLKSQSKISLKPITLTFSHSNNTKLSQFQHFIDYNLFQTTNWVFLFWPRIYNDIHDKLSRLLTQKYIPESTSLIFRAKRISPGDFYELQVSNYENSYRYVIPRIGCKAYQPNEAINKFYIFGGFYNKEQNYLQFQNDVTWVEFEDQTLQVQVGNVPKHFYFTVEDQQNIKNKEMMQEGQITEENNNLHSNESNNLLHNNNTKYIRQFKNSFIRPRIQFQIYQPQKPSSQPSTSKQVFLLGGIGQKFMRPYSLISYTCHKLTFSSSSQLLSIRHLKTNNLLPVNLAYPTKTRSPQQMNIVTNAQNRNIYLNEGTTSQQSYVVSHYRYFYDHNQEKFDYEQVYQFADIDKKTYREETNCLRRAPTDYPIKYELMASSFRGKEFYNNFIKVSSENGKRYIFQLQFQLPLQVKNIYQNYQKVVRLTGASILAIDINASMLYCLIKHPSYTLDKCILAHFDINDLAGKLVDSKTVEIHLKEIHKFDVDVSRNIIVVANSGTVAVLHGYNFNFNIHHLNMDQNSKQPLTEQYSMNGSPQLILKKYRKNQIKTFPVKPSEEKSILLQKQFKELLLLNQNKKIVNEISCSFFINQNSGIILGVTFKSIDRLKQEGKEGMAEVVYMRVQKLDMTKQEYKWKMINQRVYKLSIDRNPSTVNKSSNPNQQFSSLQYLTQSPRTSLSLMQQHIPEPHITKPHNYIRLIQIKGNKQSKQKRQKQFLLKCIYNEEIYTCFINLDILKQEVLQFQPINQPQENYYKSIYKENIKQESIYLQKNTSWYDQGRDQTSMCQNQNSSSKIQQIAEQVQKMDIEK